MKHRPGFVSNSSSSSFVVAFDKIPENVKELQHMLFGNEKIFAGYENGYPVEEIAAIVFEDMSKGAHADDWSNPDKEWDQPLCDEAVFAIFRKGYLDSDPSWISGPAGETREEESRRWKDEERRFQSER